MRPGRGDLLADGPRACRSSSRFAHGVRDTHIHGYQILAPPRRAVRSDNATIVRCACAVAPQGTVTADIFADRTLRLVGAACTTTSGLTSTTHPRTGTTKNPATRPSIRTSGWAMSSTFTEQFSLIPHVLDVAIDDQSKRAAIRWPLPRCP